MIKEEKLTIPPTPAPKQHHKTMSIEKERLTFSKISQFYYEPNSSEIEQIWFSLGHVVINYKGKYRIQRNNLVHKNHRESEVKLTIYKIDPKEKSKKIPLF